MQGLEKFLCNCLIQEYSGSEINFLVFYVSQFSLHEDNALRWVHLTDSHIPEHRDTVAWDSVKPVQVVEHSLRKISNLSNIDFLAHTGDVAGIYDVGTEREYQAAEDLFSELQMPRYYVPGNHDNPQLMKDVLSMSWREHEFSDKGTLCYQFNEKGVPFLVLDARNGRSPMGQLGAEQQEWLVERLQAASPENKAVVLIHFPLFHNSVDWIRDRRVVENADEVHSIFKQYSDRIVAVFHGHIHAATQMDKDGVHYISAPSSSYAFDLSITDDCWVDEKGLVGFNVVTLKLDDWSVSVKRHDAYELEDHSFVRHKSPGIRSENRFGY